MKSKKKDLLQRLAELPFYFFIYGIALTSSWLYLVIKKGVSQIQLPSRKLQPASIGQEIDYRFEAAQQQKPKINLKPVAKVCDEFKFIKVQGVPSGMLFYQFFEMGVIRRVQKDGQKLYSDYTRDDARLYNLDFSINGAIRYTKNEIKGMVKAKPVVTYTPDNLMPVDEYEMPPLENIDNCSIGSVAQGVTQVSEAPVAKTQYLSDKEFFTVGSIEKMGIVEKTDKQGKKYEIYTVTVQTRNGYKKDFAGEMLAELVAKNGAEVGDRVKIRKSGRENFVVTVDGKTEARSRNLFDFSILKS